jgi:ATP-dependent Clp protease ATP-binding subunit ClpB
MEKGQRLSEDTKREVQVLLQQNFRPEFLNRVDEIVIFESLRREDLGRIVDIQLARMRKLLAEKRLELDLTTEAKDFLAARGYDPVFGARPLKRAIQRYLQDPLALKVLKGECVPGDRIVVEAGKDELRFTKKAQA